MSHIIRKSAREIEIMKKAGKIVAQTLLLIESMIQPGISTDVLDQEAENFMRKNGAEPLFKGYRGFPASICASVNEEIVHGIPNNRKLNEGDIVSIDIGVRYQGYVGDSAKTFPVGKVSPEAGKLLQICKECLDRAIEAARPGNKISDIARAVQEHAEAHGYGIVRDYTGHGIGTDMHEEPQIPNYIDPSWLPYDATLKSGYCIAIEPMLNMGTHKTKTVRRQGWDIVLTKDNKWSAHFEHSVAILEKGPLILTLPE
jgi:methionyl aminopeptidase